VEACLRERRVASHGSRGGRLPCPASGSGRNGCELRYQQLNFDLLATNGKSRGAPNENQVQDRSGDHTWVGGHSFGPCLRRRAGFGCRDCIVPDTLCGYCKDITDAVTSAGSISSAYRPGIGYAMEPQGSGAFLQPTEQQESGQKLVERLQLGTNPR
jgi:hypothetical protein